MTSAAYNHLSNANEFKLITINSDNDVFYYFEITFNKLTVSISNDGLLFNPIDLKTQFDKMAGTKTRDAKRWFLRRWGKTMNLYRNEFKTINKAIWAPLRLFDVIVASYLHKFDSATMLWLDGKEEWSDHFPEFVYVRCDPKFKQEDRIIKVGRETDPSGRNANYKQHARGGPDTVFAMFYVRHGSPAEDYLKKMCHSRFQQPKTAPVSGEKLGEERFHIPPESQFDFYDIVMSLIDDFQYYYDKNIIDYWYHDRTESLSNNLKEMKAFVNKWSPQV